MTADVGLRAAKKQRTREHISTVATHLFLAHGFEATTIAQVAREAGVAKMTVTNYFPVKEDLLFDRAPELVTFLADAVAARPVDTTPLRAVRAVYERRLAERWVLLGLTGRAMWELVTTSTALQLRHRQILAEQEEALAQVLITEKPGDGDGDGGHDGGYDPVVAVRARVLAARIAGVSRVLFAEAQRRVLAGADAETVAVAMGPIARAAFDDAERADG